MINNALDNSNREQQGDASYGSETTCGAGATQTKTGSAKVGCAHTFDVRRGDARGCETRRSVLHGLRGAR